MDDPVFVIHGVGNREPDGFTALVDRLQQRSGVALVPVYWGDLGADDAYVGLALPIGASGATSGLRDDPNGSADVLAALVPTDTRADALLVFEEAVRDACDAEGLRARATDQEIDEVLDAVREAWPDTEWLRGITDDRFLRETASALAEAVLDGDDATGTWGLRGVGAPNSGSTRSAVRRQLRCLDRAAGAAVQAMAGQLNHALRDRLGPALTRFLGDVLVYQRHQAAIHARIRETVAAVDPALGASPAHPVRVVAHSLGGVIAVDLATAAEPLWTRSLLTFGSQAAYFHLCDPRGGSLRPYAPGQAVALPPSLGAWTNLWQPLDPLAFAAAGVFRLHDGALPDDLPVRHLASDGLWTHSSYWESDQLIESITRLMKD